jgi:hypothetical protein
MLAAALLAPLLSCEEPSRVARIVVTRSALAKVYQVDPLCSPCG